MSSIVIDDTAQDGTQVGPQGPSYFKTLLKTFTLCCVSLESSRKPLKNDLHVNNTCNLICKEEERKIMFVEMNSYANLMNMIMFDEENLSHSALLKRPFHSPCLVNYIFLSHVVLYMVQSLLHIKVDANPNWVTFLEAL